MMALVVDLEMLKCNKFILMRDYHLSELCVITSGNLLIVEYLAFNLEAYYLDFTVALINLLDHGKFSMIFVPWQLRNESLIGSALL